MALQIGPRIQTLAIAIADIQIVQGLPKSLTRDDNVMIAVKTFCSNVKNNFN